MDVLVITDIPRMTALFGRIAQQQAGLKVVSEIHRGIEDLENRKPDLVIFQNYLAGLSADILHKHLTSRSGRRNIRFALISTSAVLDAEVSARFELILDPALQEEDLEKAVQNLFHDQGTPARSEETLPQPTITPQALPRGQELTLPDGLPSMIPDQNLTREALQTTPIPPLPEGASEADGAALPPITYERPRRPGISIVSDFSKQLDTKADTLQPEPFTPRSHEPDAREWHRETDLISDIEESHPWYRRTGALLVLITLLVVVAVSLFQHRSNPPASTKKIEPAVAIQPLLSTTVAGDALPTPVPAQAETKQLQPSIHTRGRLSELPAFIPRDGIEQNYGKEHPGWERYRGQTSEHRVFREKNGTIKAIQIIDRSGAGIQESFYTTVLKELSGAETVRPGSSEVREGYEIRRGETTGLQLVEYRDTQGGRLRGFVVTWP